MGSVKYTQAALDPTRTTGLILCGMGGPDGPQAVEPFLRNLFRDPAIFPLPRLLAPFLGWLIAKRRSGAVAERYQLIDPSGATPQLQSTRDQARSLAGLLDEKLNEELDGSDRVIPEVAMRYWSPFPEESVAKLLDQNAQQFIIVPTYPQYSPATGGSTLDFVLDAVHSLAPGAPVHTVPGWHNLDGYIRNLSDPVIVQLREWAEAGADPQTCALIYVAHSMPETFIKKGDPYEMLTRSTVAAVQQRVRAALAAEGYEEWLDSLLSDRDFPLAYQSKVGPIKWLEPGVEPETLRLAREGCRRLMVQPVSFVCEHIETIVELDIELQDEARAAGITEFRRGGALNLDPEWLESLAEKIMYRAFRPQMERHV